MSIIFNLALLWLTVSVNALVISTDFDGIIKSQAQSITSSELKNSHSTNPRQEESQVLLNVLVTKVIDGDTFWVDDGTSQFKVRFIGVDAPEPRNTRWKKKGQYAEQSKEYVCRLTLNKRVKLVWDVQKFDRYQRMLAYVYLEDGTFLNASLVENGFAVVSTFPPNVKYVDLFLKLQHDAREKQNGLWSLPVQDSEE